MTCLLAFGALVLLLAGFDAYITARNMRKYGAEVELNPGIKWLAKYVHTESAALAGVAIPTLVILAVCSWINSCVWLALYAGVRLHLAMWQINMLRSGY